MIFYFSMERISILSIEYIFLEKLFKVFILLYLILNIILNIIISMEDIRTIRVDRKAIGTMVLILSGLIGSFYLASLFIK